jgi:two-component system, NtrC family, response regulator GlrR
VPRSLLIIGHEVWKSEDSAAGFLSREQDWCVARSSWVALTPEALRQASADLIMAVAVGHADRAMDFFQWLRMNPIDSRTFAVLPAEADLDTFQISLEAVDDFVLWPTRQDELRYRVARILGDHRQETQSLNARLNEELGLAQLIGNDPAFVQVVRRIPLFARSDAPVLITGETGTGKEMCTRAIHHVTRRRDLPLIPVDCAGIPYELFENELFGHTRGAFTDARGEQKGLAAMAQGGTLFLDEIDALPLTVQAKLLRFLQEGTYKPLGADRFVRSDVRIIAATNCDIEAMVREGHFRSDLYYPGSYPKILWKRLKLCLPS